MREVNALIESNETFRTRFERAQMSYVRERNALQQDPDLAIVGMIGGGPAHRVKCLHAHYAHYLAGGDNPVGEFVEEALGGSPLTEDPCVCSGD